MAVRELARLVAKRRDSEGVGLERLENEGIGLLVRELACLVVRSVR